MQTLRDAIDGVTGFFSGIKEGIDNFHLYTLNRSEMTKRIIEYFVVSINEDDIASEKMAS